MEDDDEFGDLYTDVLKPFTTTQSTPPPPPIQTTTATSSSRPIDLNIHSDDEEILFGAPATTNSNQSNFKISFQGQKSSVDGPGGSDLNRNLNIGTEDEVNLAGTGGKFWEDGSGRVLGSNDLGKVHEKGFEDPNFMDESGLDIVVEERDDRDENLGNFEGNNTGIEGMGMEPLIPGLSMPRVLNRDEGGGGGGQGEGEGDDWDSDSEDDLQIVLNDNTGIMGMERAGGGEDDDEDEDGDNLVIVAGNDPNHQQLEEQDWGEDAAQAAEGGERKEMGDAMAKANGGAIGAPKLGYSSHGYHHPFHSQFKYVRPGAAPMPGAPPVAPGGVPGQVRPPVGIAPFAGRGRGDWRPTGIRGATPMQKNFHPGYGAPAWGNGGAGRGFGSGLEFTLPSHKTIFEVDIDGFEEKPWRLQGIDISDFFNFGLNEESWKDYCKQLEQLRMESTMQSKIRVYESGRAEQEYDPDLPPELAAAAGIHDVSAENPNLGKVDPGHGDLAKGSARARPQFPPGRAIQVETAYAERLPSIDTRPPRMRDSDAIIEIVLQDSGDDDSYAGNDVAEHPEKEEPRGDHEIEEDGMQEEDDRFDGAPVQDLPDSRGKTAAYSGRKYNVINDERRPKRRVPDRSPSLTRSGSTQDKKSINNQKEESVESVERKQSPLSSPITGGSPEEREFEQNDARHDETLAADGSSEAEGGQALDKAPASKLKTDNPLHSMKKQKLIPRAEPSSVQEVDEGEDSKPARSSDNSKARSGSSRDYRNMRDGVDEEVVQAGRSRHMGMDKRPTNEDEGIVRGRGRNERRDMERHRVPMKGREDSYPRKKWDSNMAQHSHTRGESLDRRKDGDPDGVWQRKDEDLHGGRTRADDTRKRERGDEMVPRHRSKVRENERNDKDEYQSRKVLENGNWKGYHDKDLVPRHKDRDDSLKIRNDSLDDLHSKRRKEEVHLRRDHSEKEENFHVQKESTSRRKREREDILDQRKRDDQARLREDDQHVVRHNKEEVWLQRERVERQRERDEWHRLKQSQEENLIKREREEGRGGVRSGRLVEDKAWAGHSRVKEEFKGSDREHQMKETGRHSEQINRRDRVDNESLSRHRGRDDAYVRGNQLNNDERRSRQERGSTGPERPVSISDNHRPQDKKHKENPRKNKESEVGDRNSLAPSRRNREDHGGQRSERVSGRGLLEQGSGEHDNPANRQASRKHKEDASSDEEQQDSRKGRSKLERWTSHKERDFGIGIKPSASLNVKEIDRHNNNGGPSLVGKGTDESSKAEEIVDNSHPQIEQTDGGLSEFKNDDSKPSEDKHLDTVEKLKKRSERFKLPMPSEKETVAVKKTENEPLPPPPPEPRADLEIKQERPARKRRWTSS